MDEKKELTRGEQLRRALTYHCLLYTSDAADD